MFSSSTVNFSSSSSRWTSFLSFRCHTLDLIVQKITVLAGKFFAALQKLLNLAMSCDNLIHESQSVTSESNVKSLILLTTGRNRDLVEWELTNQSLYSGIPLISFSPFLDRSSSDSCRLYGDGKMDVTESTGNASTIRQRKALNEVLFKAELDCSGHADHVLQAVIANCILLRNAYEEVVSYSVGTEQLWKNLLEMNLASSVTNINFIGRRIKAEKVIEQALVKLNQKSRKRKSEHDAVTVTASGIENEDRVNPMKEMKQLAHIDTECSEQSNKRALKSCSDIHLLSDLRGLTNADEKNTLYYAVAFYCSGGDSASQKFEKKYNNENKNIYTDSAQTLGVQNALATSSNSTTIMDFLRCYLTITSARVTPGDLIIDPFAGSGAILRMGSCFGATVMSSDIDPICCAHNTLHKSTKGNCVLGDMKNPPWRGTYNAVVTDPPYNIRTHLLKEQRAKVLDASLPHDSSSSDSSVLEGLIAFAATHLVPLGRLVFWWPEIEGSSMKVHDLVEKLIENSTNSTGSRMLRIISICHDDHGMGKMEEKGKKEKSRKEENIGSSVKKGKHDSSKNTKAVTDEEHTELLKKKNKGEEYITNDAEMLSDPNIKQNNNINLVADIHDNESKMPQYNVDSMHIRWTRCLITIEKIELTANSCYDIVRNNNKKSENDDNKLTCLPNIFEDKKKEKSSITSKEFDNFIYLGFRKELFKATWKGDVSALKELEAKVGRILNPDSRNTSVLSTGDAPSSVPPLSTSSSLDSSILPPCSLPSTLTSIPASSTVLSSSHSSPVLVPLPTFPSPSFPSSSSVPTPFSPSPAPAPSSSMKRIWDCEDANGSRPIMFAAGYGHVEVLRWLVQRGCDIDYSPKGGAGPAVLRAARFGHAACVSLLQSQGCDLSLTDSDGYTAAAHALAFDHISVVEILPIVAFFTENLNSKIDMQPSRISTNNQVKETSDTNIHTLKSRNNENKVSAQMKDNINMEVECSTISGKSDVKVEVPWVIMRSAFHIICQWGSIKSLNYLLALKGLKTEERNVSEFEGLGSIEISHHLNTKNENYHTVTDDLFPVNYSLIDGSTALHVAARYGHINCLKKLIEAGGDFRVVDIHGNTPLLLSRKWGRTECDVYLSDLHDTIR